MEIIEVHKDNYTISTDKSRLDIDVIHGFLSTSYWAKNIPRSIVEKSIEYALCFGIYYGAAQVGFSRIISDYSTVAYLGDVFILDAHRGKGLSKWMMRCIMAHPALQGLRSWYLATADAHGLYKQFGFEPLADPSRIMAIRNPNIYG
jgi:GNAT superfamily N-acetyltransferase